jgi:hypothetical protein
MKGLLWAQQTGDDSDPLRISTDEDPMTKHPIASFVLALAAACGGASTSSPAATPPESTAAASDPSCPVAVPGTSVSVEDTDTGAALVFVTTGDVAELRRRVAEMARMHNDHHSKMGALPSAEAAPAGEHAGHAGHAGHDQPAGGEHAGHGSQPAGGKHAGHGQAAQGAHEHAGHAGGMIGVHSQATTEDIEGGARLVFAAATADSARLRDELRMHQQHLSAGTCAMGHGG